MNPQSHRLVFNPTRGCLMAVAETSRSCGKSGASGASRSTRAKRTHRQCQPLPAPTTSDASIYLKNTHEALVLPVQPAITSGVFAAAGKLTLAASGAGQDSHILIQGSEVKAGQNATLNADGQVNLLAAQNTAKQTSSNSSSSASVGVAVTFGPKGAAAGFTASASAARGNADGADQIASNSHISAGHTANIQSGGDTTLQGAVIAANTVKTDVGGKLNIESTQDTSQFDAKQSSAGAGVSLCIPPLCR